MSDATLLDLLDALADGERHSGEALATRFGISRAALAKRVDKLRDWGVALDAQPGAGYRLGHPLQRLDAAGIAAALPPAVRALGLAVAVAARVDSSNSRLLAADPALDPQALFAESQTAGRGRRGRDWVSPFGSNLYLSLAWSFPAWPARLTTLPLAVAVALARALAALGLPEAGIKWPNDLHADGRKLAGVLIEPRGEAGGPCRVVVGVGLNLHMQEPQAVGLSQPWTSLAAALAARGRAPPARQAVAVAVLTELALALRNFQDHGFSPFAAEWRGRDLLRDLPVRVEGAGGCEGIARGIDSDGGLIVEGDGGRRVVHAGDVSVRAQ
ncbi:MAG: biotin--[acetyl-CoA-carboxylase] ligase [Stagnimonas sp.]|nr:biotin--[acetyl-CoA-carboxylase] ligase [Stagnimonas sp.]